MNFMKHRKLIVIIGSVLAVAVLAVVGYSIFGARSGAGANTITVAPTDLTEQVTMTGKVKAADEVDLAFERGGRVVAVPVAVGDTVKRGALLAAVDASDAGAASKEADAALASAQIALEKMKRPPEAIDLMTAKDAVASASDAKDKAASDLNKDYDGAYSAIFDTYLDLQTITSGLRDVLHGTNLNPGQDNIDFYADLVKVTDPNADAYRASTEASYEAAVASVDRSYADFKAAGPAPAPEVTAKLLSETYDTDKLVSDAVKSANDLIGFYLTDLTKNQLLNTVNVPPAVPEASAELSGFANEANAHFAALSGAQTAIHAGSDGLAVAARSLTEKQEALDKLVAGAEDIDIRAQQTRVDAAQAADAAAHSEAAKTALIAPFDGTISQVNVSIGELASPGAPAVAMVSNARYEIDALVSEADIAKVAVGASATVTLDTFGSGENFAATVTAVQPAETIVNNIGAYGIKLQFVNDDSRIKSGMTANIFITTGVRKAVLALPASAIITSGADKFVFVDNGSSKSVKTPVTVGITAEDGRVEIVSGLKAGDKVVTYGNN
jgi:RND family efflux transporter MFP subunit